MQQQTRAGDQKSAGHLADAGPYVYDLPATRGGQQAGRHEPQGDSSSSKGILSLILLNVLARGLHDFYSLPLLHSFIIVCGVGAIIGYWGSPRPRQSFLSWTLKIVGLCLNIYIGLVTVPASLRGQLPDPLAFGLPAFALFLIFYWVPPLRTNRVKCPFWQWLLCAAGFAVIWSWAGPSQIW